MLYVFLIHSVIVTYLTFSDMGILQTAIQMQRYEAWFTSTVFRASHSSSWGLCRWSCNGIVTLLPVFQCAGWAVIKTVRVVWPLSAASGHRASAVTVPLPLKPHAPTVFRLQPAPRQLKSVLVYAETLTSVLKYKAHTLHSHTHTQWYKSANKRHEYPRYHILIKPSICFGFSMYFDFSEPFQTLLFSLSLQSSRMALRRKRMRFLMSTFDDSRKKRTTHTHLGLLSLRVFFPREEKSITWH